MKTRMLVLLLVMTSLLAACGDRGSGFAPAENAVTANPEATIDLRSRDYELPPAVPAPEGPTASYDTGDSSGGRTLTLDALNPALEAAASETKGELADAAAENAVEPGKSTTIADETSEGDAAAATGGDQNVTTDTADTLNDTVVEPGAAGENANENVTATDQSAETGGAAESGGATEVGAETGGAVPPAESASEAAPSTSATETGGTETGGTAATAATPETTADQAAADQAATTEQPETAETGGAGSTEAATGGASGGTAATTTATAASQTPAARASSFDWQELGTTTYDGNCAACHQQNGQGIPGAFPPLAGHIDELYNAEGGRKYIVNVVLYGLQGEIQALSQTYNSVMTPWSQLSDEQIAATLNHELTSWGNDALEQNFSPILPAEVEAERGNNLSAAQVLELRPQLP